MGPSCPLPPSRRARGPRNDRCTCREDRPYSRSTTLPIKGATRARGARPSTASPRSTPKPTRTRPGPHPTPALRSLCDADVKLHFHRQTRGGRSTTGRTRGVRRGRRGPGAPPGVRGLGARASTRAPDGPTRGRRNVRRHRHNFERFLPAASSPSPRGGPCVASPAEPPGPGAPKRPVHVPRKQAKTQNRL